MTDPRTDEVTAVSAEYMRSEWIAVDSATGRDLAKLERKFDATVEIGSQSDDDTLWVVGAVRPDRPMPGTCSTGAPERPRPFFSARPKLDKVRLAPMHGVVITARDGLEPCLLPDVAGGRDRSRDLRVRCLWCSMCTAGPGGATAGTTIATSSGYANRNYAVLQVNYRGSSGFGKTFINAGDREWAGKMHDDLIDAVNWSIAESIADPKRIAIYGGFLWRLRRLCRRHLHAGRVLLQRVGRWNHQP